MPCYLFSNMVSSFLEGVTQAVHELNLYFVEVSLEPGAMLPLLQHGLRYPRGPHTSNTLSESLFCGGISGTRCLATPTPTWSPVSCRGSHSHSMNESLLFGGISGANYPFSNTAPVSCRGVTQAVLEMNLFYVEVYLEIDVLLPQLQCGV